MGGEGDNIQRTPRPDLLQNGLVGSPYSPRDSQGLGAVKVEKKKKKNKLEMFRPAHCSLYLLCSQEKGKKNSFLSFTCHCNNTSPLCMVSVCHKVTSLLVASLDFPSQL